MKWVHHGPLAWLGQAVAYVLFGAVIGTFASAPRYSVLEDGQALIRLSLSHSGQRKFECRRLTPEEIAALAPNMRTPMDCPRERLPVTVQLELDGKALFLEQVEPSGIAGDVASTIYEQFVVPSGMHTLVARLRDSARSEGFDYESELEARLEPSDILVVDFDAAAGSFEFR